MGMDFFLDSLKAVCLVCKDKDSENTVNVHQQIVDLYVEALRLMGIQEVVFLYSIENACNPSCAKQLVQVAPVQWSRLSLASYCWSRASVR